MRQFFRRIGLAIGAALLVVGAGSVTLSDDIADALARWGEPSESPASSMIDPVTKWLEDVSVEDSTRGYSTRDYRTAARVGGVITMAVGVGLMGFAVLPLRRPSA